MGLKISAKAFNLAVAAFAGASLAFAAFAMPAGLFEDLVAATRLPLILSGAEAPLGIAARLVAMAVGGGALFLLVWGLLGFIDHLAEAAPPSADDDFFDLEFDPPRLRRADAHPDAPSRHPIRARREFGEPLEEQTVPDSGQDAAVEPAEPSPLPDALPSFLANADAPGEAVAEVAEEGPSEALEPGALEEPAEAADPADEPASEPFELAGFEEMTDVAVPADESVPEPFAEPLDLVDEIDDAAEIDGLAAGPDDDDGEPHGDLGYEIPVARIHPPEDRGESISGLLERLDSGFGECEWPLDESGATPPLRQLDDRLRNALDQLQKMASRGGG
jgi:hypothetical protein